MYCEHCGYRNVDEAQFCENCGSPLTPVRPPVRQMDNGGKRDNKVVMIVGIVAGVLALAAVTFGVVSYLNQQSPDTDTTASTSAVGVDPDNGYDEGYDEGYSDGLNDGGGSYDGGNSYDDSSNIYGHDDDIISYSSQELLTWDDIDYLSDWQIQYAANEIYARHGAIFEDQDVRNYFYSKSWYHPYQSKADARSDCSSIEVKNLEFLYNVLHPEG